MRRGPAVLVLLVLALSTGPALAVRDFSRPASYDDFVDVNTYPTVADAISAESYLYFPPGEYILPNPIVIDRQTPLFLHGGDRMKTRIRSQDPTQPTFVVREATLINITGLRPWPAFEPSTGFSSITGSRNFVFENAIPLELEIQDSFFTQSRLEIRGPASVRMQGVVFSTGGYVDTPVLIDHPDADVLIVGGNINSTNSPADLGTDQQFHAWTKRGRFRIYGTGTQSTRGRADFRIDTPSRLGPHAIVNVRSEGFRKDQPSPLPSSHLYVPPGGEPVDVVMMNNSGSWGTSGTGASHYAEYHAAGTLWLIQNNSVFGAGRLVIGNAPSATIVALGNRLYDNADILPVTAAQKIFAGNVYSYRQLTGDTAEPNARFVNPSVTLSSYANVPPVPEIVVPMPLRRIPVRSRQWDMLDVTDFGAVGDGTTDDTAAIQAAFDAGKVIFLPAGTYRITQPLGFVHSVHGSTEHMAGGWIAGEGSGLTRIVRDPADKGSVFLSEGMAYIAVQGIAFVTAPYDPAEPTPIDEPCVDLENNPTYGHATQEVTFDGCEFVGGKYALGIGLTTGTNCSENLIVGSTLRDAKIGLAIGSYNALANIVYDGTFRDNQITMGHSEELSGGTWAVLHANVRGTAIREFNTINSASGIWYSYGLDSDSPKFVHRPTGVTGATFPFLFDHSTLAPASPDEPVFDFITSGGLVFLASSVPAGEIRHAGGISVNFSFRLHSDIASWGATTVGSIHRIYALDTDPDGDGVFHPIDNCPAVSNLSQLDSDADGHGDACDCAPMDPGSFAPPAEVEGLTLFLDSETLSWLGEAHRSGPGTAFDVFREDLAFAPAGSAPGAICSADDLPDTWWADPAVPSPGTGRRYLVRAANGCGAGTWGTSGSGAARTVTTCP